MRQFVFSLLAAGLALCGTAKADMIYDFTGTPVWPHAYPGPTMFDIALDITDAQAATGSFNLHGIGLTPAPPSTETPTFSGNIAGLVSLAISGMETATPTIFPTWNYFDVKFTFGPNDQIVSDAVTFGGDDGTAEGVISGSAGYLGSDGPWCNAGAASHLCSVSGSWSAVVAPGGDDVLCPEPASLLLMMPAFACMAFLARRRVPSRI